jgi:hypothetical protein
MTDDLPDETGHDDALADPVFDELFTALREAGRAPAPPVQPALAALLTTGAVARRRRGARGATVGLAVVGVLAGGVGAAAATGHLAVRPPAVTRVVERPSEAPVTGEPGEPTSVVGIPTATATAHEAPADGESVVVVDPGTEAGPATRPTRTHDDDESSASDETSSDDRDGDGDAEEDAETPVTQESTDDDSGDGGDDHSGPGGGGGDRSDDPDDGTSQDGSGRDG